MRPANVNVHIEELVLHGFAPGDRHRVATALQAELTRLLAETGAPPAWSRNAEIPRLDAGAIDAAPSSRPETVGAHAARAIHRGWNTP
jgi:hypothetical protein